MNDIRVNVLALSGIAAAVVGAMLYFVSEPAIVAGVAGAFIGGLISVMKTLAEPGSVPASTVEKMLDSRSAS